MFPIFKSINQKAKYLSCCLFTEIVILWIKYTFSLPAKKFKLWRKIVGVSNDCLEIKFYNVTYWYWVYVFFRKHTQIHTHYKREFKNLMGFSKNVVCYEFFAIFFMIMSVLKLEKNSFIKKG